MTDSKTIKVRPHIAEHDLSTKMTHAIKFLKAGSRVQIVVMMRGRERSRPEIASAMLDRVVAILSDYGKPAGTRAVASSQHSIYLAPK